MIIIKYPSNKNAYAERNIASWAKTNKLDYVLEIHRNAFNKSARGYETLIYSKFSPDKVDTAIHNFLKVGYINRGIKKRSDLYNMNQMSSTGISYSLVEIGFVDNSSDNKVFDSNLSRINNGLASVIAEQGVKRLGVVYGHGNGDPGATDGRGRTEANDVRKITLSSTGGSVPNNHIHWFISNNGKKYYYKYYGNSKVINDSWKHRYRKPKTIRYLMEMTRSTQIYRDSKLKIKDTAPLMKKGERIRSHNNVDELK